MTGENSLNDAEGEHCARLRREAPQVDFEFRLTECPKTISCDVVFAEIRGDACANHGEDGYLTVFGGLCRFNVKTRFLE